MKPLLFLTLILASVAAGAGLTPTGDGITVDTGTLGSFTLGCFALITLGSFALNGLGTLDALGFFNSMPNRAIGSCLHLICKVFDFVYTFRHRNFEELPVFVHSVICQCLVYGTFYAVCRFSGGCFN